MKYKGMMVFGVLLAMGISAHAAEKASAAKHGLRISVRNHPGINEREKEPAGGATEIAVLEDDAGAQVDIIYHKRFLGKDGQNVVGGSVGGGVFFAGASGEDVEEKVEIGIGGIMGQGGLVVQPVSFLVLEAGVSLGLGAGSLDIEDKTGAIEFEDGAAAYVSYAAKLGAYFLLGNNIELGVETGYLGYSAFSAIEVIGGTDYDVTYSGDGFQGGLVLGIKF